VDTICTFDGVAVRSRVVPVEPDVGPWRAAVLTGRPSPVNLAAAPAPVLPVPRAQCVFAPINTAWTQLKLTSLNSIAIDVDSSCGDPSGLRT
jgi:hypothetical protein